MTTTTTPSQAAGSSTPMRGLDPLEQALNDHHPEAVEDFTDLVNSTPEQLRWALFDALAQAITDTTPVLPADGRCSCGHDLRVDGAYSLDYSCGWQNLTHDPASGDWTGSNDNNDQHTVADLMCRTCYRLYNLPPATEITWN